jgi:hypothetical protein
VTGPIVTPRLLLLADLREADRLGVLAAIRGAPDTACPYLGDGINTARLAERWLAGWNRVARRRTLPRE